MSNIEMTNMCMIYDKTNRKVLVQERKKSWKGISFPGGHVEDGESIIQSTIREIKEETGLIVENLKPCGIVYWFNTDTSERYIVFNLISKQMHIAAHCWMKLKKGRYFGSILISCLILTFREDY